MEEMELESGDVLMVEGLLDLKVKKGEVSVSGGLHKKGERITVPKAKAVPLEASEDAMIKYEKKEGGEIERLSERTIPPDWDSVIDEIIEAEPEGITVLGETDTGKTFFSTYMANRLLNNDISSAIVDTDAGQSDIGPPGSIGLGLVNSHIGLLSEVQTRDAYFIGSMSPSGHMLEYMVGMKKMAEFGLEEADLTIVDTPGWVTGGAGRALQHFGAELLDPDFVIGLQRENELEHLLKSVPGKVRRLSVSEKVRERSREERSALRKKALSEYFEGSEEIVLDIDNVGFDRTYLDTGKEIESESLNIEGVVYAEEIREGIVVVSEKELDEVEKQKLRKEFGKVNAIKTGDEKYVFVSLVGEGRNLIGVGSINEIDYPNGKIKITAPKVESGKVDKIQFGSMKIKPSGEEVGTVRPGTF